MKVSNRTSIRKPAAGGFTPVHPQRGVHKPGRAICDIRDTVNLTSQATKPNSASSLSPVDRLCAAWGRDESLQGASASSSTSTPVQPFGPNHIDVFNPELVGP
jgi:hypothetical protein